MFLKDEMLVQHTGKINTTVTLGNYTSILLINFSKIFTIPKEQQEVQSRCLKGNLEL